MLGSAPLLLGARLSDQAATIEADVDRWYVDLSQVLRVYVEERFGVPRIIEMYGATEGNVALQNLDGRVGSVGKPPGMPEGHVALVPFPSAKQMALVLTGGRLLAWSLGFSGKPKQYLGDVPLSAISEVHYGQVSFGGLIRVVMASTAVVDLEVMRGEPGDEFFAQLEHLVNNR